MNSLLIGREEEQQILKEALLSLEAEMIAVIGRRRVGKTYLINTVYQKQMAFELTGLQNAPLEEQLSNFAFWLTQASKSLMPVKTPKNWLEAFHLLITYLNKKLETTDEKIVVFFDELSWLSTPKSGFLRGLGMFWNSWASRNRVIVVICGSAASWMIQKVVNHKGGLHNRITKRINLKPFTLSETKAYLNSRNIHFTDYQITEIYMAIGGIPHYLKEIKAGKSVAQNIDQLLFSSSGILNGEFSRLYEALFDNADRHIAVIRILGEKKKGLTRGEIIKGTKIPNGGTLTKILEELEQSGFITTYFPFGKKTKNKTYRLTDEYSLFYLHFIEKRVNQGVGTWLQLSQTSAYRIWSGYAFEGICIKHIPQIKKALGIGGVYTLSFSFLKRGDESETGAQIDLVLDRADNIINLFEIKFYNDEYTVTKDYAKKLRTKRTVFQTTTKTKKYLSWAMISTYGVKHNQHSLGLVEHSVTLEDLFK